MIELRALAYFDAACRSETLGLAANKLGIALSTLSAALKALEQDLGMPLFRRLAGGLYPTAAARSLMRSADPLLIVERFARRFVAGPSNTRLKVLTVDLALSSPLAGSARLSGRPLRHWPQNGSTSWSIRFGVTKRTSLMSRGSRKISPTPTTATSSSPWPIQAGGRERRCFYATAGCWLVGCRPQREIGRLRAICWLAASSCRRWRRR
jgi:hypothetical protein